MLNYFKGERMAICVRAVQNFFARYFLREQNQEDRANKIETYLSIVYKLLIWEDLFLSGVAFFLAHVLFWFVIYFELRLYGILFISLLMLFIFDAGFDNLKPEADMSIPLKSIRETVKIVSAFVQYLVNLRREHPGTFCVGMCTTFLLLSIVGRTLSGLFLSYFGLLSFLLMPGVIYRLPPEVLEALKHALHVISTDEGVVAENELFPATHEDEALEERDADCDSLKTDHTADSCTNSFITGVTSMPSYLDAEGSLDGLDEDDLEFAAKNHLAVTPLTYSSDSSDGEHKDIKFESSHFNRDSSSDEEHNYAQGLTFTELETSPNSFPTPNSTPSNAESIALSFTQQLSADLLSNLGSMGSSLVSTVMKTAAANPPAPRRSDSDSDFEIIDSDDVQSDGT